jgi:hypothetical protein
MNGTIVYGWLRLCILIAQALLLMPTLARRHDPRRRQTSIMATI